MMKLKSLPILSGLVTYGSLLALLSDYKRPNDKISYMIKKGELIPVKRGLYFFNETYKNGELSLFQVANLIYGPSYVSSYSALAYYGLIPEKVNIVESVSIKRSKLISTSIGNFNYFSSVREIFHIGINYLQPDTRTAFLIASPTKALCDILWNTRRLNIRNTTEMEAFLGDDIRFDFDRLNELELNEIEKCIKSNKKKKQLKYLQNLVEANV